MTKEKNFIPRFVSIVVIVLGCVDLFRGFMHTVNLGYASQHIAGLDLSGATAFDQLQLMAVFGMSNFVSGAALILIGRNSRKISLAMLGLIPASYLIGMASLKYYGAAYAPSQANWGGMTFMMVYLSICVLSFVTGYVMMRKAGARA